MIRADPVFRNEKTLACASPFAHLATSTCDGVLADPDFKKEQCHEEKESDEDKRPA
jgi:hypothetical protein